MAVADPSPAATAVRLRPRAPAAGPAVETPQLSVVVVNFCQWQNTARLTRQLRRSEAVRRGAAEVVIVDNRSPHHPLARRLARLSGVTVVRAAENGGFARAVNRGGGLSRGDWVLLLNPDVTVPDGFLDEVLDAAGRWPARDPRTGVVGFALKHRDGSRQASCGPFPTFASTVGGLLRPRRRRKCRHQPPAGRRPVEWVTGGCLLARRDCFTRLGGLDERFFLYYEDVDFCRRARQAGWGVWHDPALRVTHHFPLHERAVPPPLRLVTRHALLTYAGKHWPHWQTSLLGRVVWAESLARGWLARWRGDPVAAGCFGLLRELVGDLRAGRPDRADERVRQAARLLAPVAAAQDGRTA